MTEYVLKFSSHHSRVCSKLSESAVRDTQLDALLMSFFSGLGFLLQKFWEESELFFLFWLHICMYLGLHLSSIHLLLALALLYWRRFCMSHKIFSCSSEEKVACQMILDKMGLKGYQVHLIPVC